MMRIDRRRTIPFSFAMTVASAVVFLTGEPVQAGSLEPSAPPGPSMKTLDQVEPGRPITLADMPLTISQAGRYYFTGDINTGGGGITVTASGNVVIDLMGYKLQGGTGNGITTGGTRVTVKNGHVLSWSGDGINGGDATQVFNVVADLNDGHGISVDTAAHVVGCRAFANGLTGITVGQNSRVVDAVVYANNSHGISTSAGCVVTGSTANSNGGTGIVTGTGCTVTTSAARQNALGGYSIASGSSIIGCIAGNNTGDGIVAITGSHIMGCAVSNSTGDGIQVSGSCYVSGNTLAGNGAGASDGAGIHITGVDNRIDGNTVTGADRGIDVDNSGNLIIRNSASGNTVQYDIVGGNDVGPIGTAAASTSPWANISF